MSVRIARSVANLHKAASPFAEVVTQALYGERLVLLEQKKGWSFVQTEDGYAGWVSETAYIGVDREPIWQHRVSSLFAHVYSTPSIDQHPPLLTLPFFAPLAFVSGGQIGKWQKIRFLDNTFAWIHQGDTGPVNTISLEEMLCVSRRFVGLPYTWGGTTSFGFDCSGLVQMLFKLIGILLPRDSYQQADSSLLTPVEVNYTCPGDLLFYGKGGRITHVALKLHGEEVLHAKASLLEGAPAVHIHALCNPPWEEPLICARRLISTKA